MTILYPDSKIGFIISLLLLTITINGQTDYDLLQKNDILILKTDSVSKGKVRIPITEIKSIKDAEPLYGKNYSTIRQHSIIFNDNFTNVSFWDGLDLEFSDTLKTLFTFKVKSIAYTMCLLTGKQIKIGMSGAQLSEIFPKSYANRRIETDRGLYEGKTILRVYFSNEKDSNIIGYGSALVLILLSHDNTLYEFLTHEPD